MNELHREWAKKNPGRTKLHADRYYLKAMYGLTIEQFEALLAAQGGVCAICREGPSAARRLCVDHDHSTKVVRGILCTKCNTGIGQLGDSVALLESALAYLRK